ncbi:MAG: precorrin-3B C(17)-methyltransferase [Aestuariivita sp.]|nr:precorrin-3B C(17)-methyltransferase [Aestuariivita sp.]
MKGWLAIVGLGPGSENLITPQVSKSLAEATDIVGYISYVNRLPQREGVMYHPSGNRVELDRARQALEMVATGQRVVIVTSGDPGVFAMASAVFEVIDDGPKIWCSFDIRVLPGVTAMLAAAARIGAPLGNDFCAINLSDNLKPWDLIEKRLRLALAADFVIACYNPQSKGRPDGFSKVLEVLNAECTGSRVLIFARAVFTVRESIRVVRLKDCLSEMVDMQTLIFIGASTSRVIKREGNCWVYTPRAVVL